MLLHRRWYLWLSAVAVAACVILAIVLCCAQVAPPLTLQYGDGTEDDKRSFGAGGHLTMFDAPKDRMWLNKMEVFGSRYGLPQPPDEDFKVYLVDGNRQVLREIALPYLLWERGADYWRTLPSPPIQVPQQFGIGLCFFAHQTKGVYVGLDKVAGSHSYAWSPGEEGKLQQDMDWMVRATVGEKAEGDPAATDLVIQPDRNAFFDRLMNAGGDPLTVTLAGRGKLPKEQVSSIRTQAVTVPGAAQAVVHLVGGGKITGTIVALNDKTLRLRVGDADRDIPRSDVVRIDFP